MVPLRITQAPAMGCLTPFTMTVPRCRVELSVEAVAVLVVVMDRLAVVKVALVAVAVLVVVTARDALTVAPLDLVAAAVMVVVTSRDAEVVDVDLRA